MKFLTPETQLRERAAYAKDKNMPVTARVLLRGADELKAERDRSNEWWDLFIAEQAKCCAECAWTAEQLKHSFMVQCFMPESK